VEPTIHVLTTTYDATRAALGAAIPLAKGSDARLIVIVVTTPDRDGEIRRYHDLVSELDGHAQFRLCICHKPDDAVDQLLPRGATVVLGGHSAEAKLARRMTKCGHRVIFVPVAQDRSSSAFGSLFSLGSTG
jgi:hypothetical protein